MSAAAAADASVFSAVADVFVFYQGIEILAMVIDTFIHCLFPLLILINLVNDLIILNTILLADPIITAISLRIFKMLLLLIMQLRSIGQRTKHKQTAFLLHQKIYSK